MSDDCRVTTPLRLLKEATVLAPTQPRVATSKALAGSRATVSVPRGSERLPAGVSCIAVVKTAAPEAACDDPADQRITPSGFIACQKAGPGFQPENPEPFQ